MSKPQLGFIGLGLMGQALTAHLTECGYQVTGYDIDGTKVERAGEHGVVRAFSSAEVAEASDIVLMCVISTDAVEEVVFGEAGVAAGGSARARFWWITQQPSSATPKTWPARLKALCGMGWVDAPVSGGPPAARSGSLAIMAGGDAADIQTVQPVMATSPAGSLTLARLAPARWPRWSIRFWC